MSHDEVVREDYKSGEEMALDGWRYLKSGRVCHYTDSGSIYGENHSYRYARCGVGTSDEHWYGTGSQEEYEKLFTLPACKGCCK